MDLLKLEDQTLAKLYEAFKDNDGFMVREDDKYANATNEILGLHGIEDISKLTELRNNFVYTVGDLMTAARALAKVDSTLGKLYNIYMNMLQYVTTEIDGRIAAIENC